MSDLTPPTDDVLQEEEKAAPITAIPVTVEGPARVQQLPTRSAGMRTFDLTLTAVKILEQDPRRRRAVLQAVGDSIMIGPTQAAASAGATFTDGVVIELTTCDDVWARATSTTAKLGVINEQWAP
jgi:hypothetical protein